MRAQLLCSLFVLLFSLAVASEATPTRVSYVATFRGVAGPFLENVANAVMNANPRRETEVSVQ